MICIVLVISSNIQNGSLCNLQISLFQDEVNGWISELCQLWQTIKDTNSDMYVPMHIQTQAESHLTILMTSKTAQKKMYMRIR